jgi:hypothetical protein
MNSHPPSSRRTKTLEQIAGLFEIQQSVLKRCQETRDIDWLDTATIIKDTINNLKQCLI